MSISATRVLAAGTAAAVLALAGCGGGGDDDKADKPSSASSSTTSDAATPAGSDTPAPAGSGAGTLSEVLAKTMNEGKSAHVTLDLGDQGSGEGDISFGGDSPAMQLQMEVAGRDTEMRLVDGAVYISVPGRDGKFVKMATGQAGSALGMDPSQALEQLEKSGAKAKDLGDGHWQLRKDGVTTDLYAGDSGYLERIEASGGGSQTVEMTYSDWGKKVTVEAPSPADIVKVPGT